MIGQSRVRKVRDGERERGRGFNGGWEVRITVPF